jgi:hypothetical protein
MEALPEHAVPAGPLAVRWLAWELPPVQAGALARIEVELENAGLAGWRDGVNLAYHWLDARGNAIVWDGIRTPVELAPGERVALDAPLRGPIPPGRYRLALDLVSEGRFWFAELGNFAPTADVEVAPRDAAAAQAFLPDDAEPAPDWHERVRALHEEGYAAVAGSIAAEGGLLRRGDPALAPYVPGGGRNPTFAHPLVCPSLLPPLEPNAEVAGLPAWAPDPDGDEPWLYDGRVTVRLRSRSGRRRA